MVWLTGQHLIAPQTMLMKPYLERFRHQPPRVSPEHSINRVPFRALHINPAGWGLPLVPAWFRLGDGPAGCLFYLVALSAAGAGVACAGSSALVVRDGVLEVAFPGVS